MPPTESLQGPADMLTTRQDDAASQPTTCQDNAASQPTTCQDDAANQPTTHQDHGANQPPAKPERGSMDDLKYGYNRAGERVGPYGTGVLAVDDPEFGYNLAGQPIGNGWWNNPELAYRYWPICMDLGPWCGWTWFEWNNFKKNKAIEERKKREKLAEEREKGNERANHTEAGSSKHGD